MRQYATYFGITALFIWSLGPLFNIFVARVPIFEILTVSLGIAALLGLVQLIITGNWHRLKQNVFFFIIGFAGIFGNELLFITAFKFAPPEHVILLNYLWPLEVVSLSWLIRGDHFSLRYFLAGCLGFTSVTYFILQDCDGVIATRYLIGYGAILLGSGLWSLYNLINKNAQQMPNEMITVYCALGFLISLTLHLTTETFYLPSPAESLALFWLGMMGMGLAFKFWDFGIKYGNYRGLSILSYNNIIFATAFLIIFNHTAFTAPLIIATVGILMASLIAFYPSKLNTTTLLTKVQITND